jgi:hypothetical protein
MTDRRTIVPALQRCLLHATDRVKYAPLTAAETADALDYHARELRWLHSIVTDLDRAL